VIRQVTGIVGDVRGIASTGLRAVRTRLELASIELTEEKAWLVRFLLIAVAALYLLTFGLLLGVCALALFASTIRVSASCSIAMGNRTVARAAS